MARQRALAESQWFELADQLTAAGQSPTVKNLAAAATERYGVAASFTTIQEVLGSWRLLGGSDRPREFSPEFLQIVLRGFAPIYQQLLSQARAEFEPRLQDAEQRSAAATSKLDALHAELQQLADERSHLRGQLQVAGEREREVSAEGAAAKAKTHELQGLLLQATENAREHANELVRQQQRAQLQRVADLEQFTEQQRVAIDEVRTTLAKEARTLLERHESELKRTLDERVATQDQLRSCMQEKVLLEAQLETEGKVLQDAQRRLASADERAQELGSQLQSTQSRVQRTEQSLRAARAANNEITTAYEARIGQLQAQLGTLAVGQQAIEQRFTTLFEQLRLREVPSLKAE